jgi:hypothetical protein
MRGDFFIPTQSMLLAVSIGRHLARWRIAAHRERRAHSGVHRIGVAGRYAAAGSRDGAPPRADVLGHAAHPAGTAAAHGCVTHRACVERSPLTASTGVIGRAGIRCIRSRDLPLVHPGGSERCLHQ